MADHIADTIAEQIPARSRDTPERRRKRAGGRLEFLREPGVEHDPKYVAVSPEDRRDRLPDPVAARLKQIYRALGVHAIGAADDDAENYILTRILTIFEEDNDRKEWFEGPRKNRQPINRITHRCSTSSPVKTRLR